MLYIVCTLYIIFVIEKATDSALPSEDWALIIEICDIINETDDGYVFKQKVFKWYQRLK